MSVQGRGGLAGLCYSQPKFSLKGWRCSSATLAMMEMSSEIIMANEHLQSPPLPTTLPTYYAAFVEERYEVAWPRFEVLISVL